MVYVYISPFFYSILVLVCAVVAVVQSASMNVHSLVSYRAQEYFAGIPNDTSINITLRTALQNAIDTYPESVAAGSDFPDFLYACGTYPGNCAYIYIYIHNIYTNKHTK